MILVTGAAGHLGNVLIRELNSLGKKVRALVLPGENLRSLEGLDYDLFEGNILDKPALLQAMQGVDTVFHLASVVAITNDKFDLMKLVNVKGTQNVLEAAKETGVKKVVYTSSIHALGRPKHGKIIDETLQFDTKNPAGAYDQTKAQASILALEAAQRGQDVVLVCPTGVIGPYDYNRSEMGEMILSWMRKKPSLTLNASYDFADVRDVMKGHILAAEKGRSGEAYLLSGTDINIRRMRKLVQDAMGIKTPEVSFPIWVAKAIAPLAEIWYKIARSRPRLTKYAVETLLSNSDISSAKARSELGYTTRPIEETVKDTVRWWKDNIHKTHSSLRLEALLKGKPKSAHGGA
ncbi:MAG: SDR family oxidoreductase [Anaerolineaceae bacterium]|nr:SDR family oxidoreductase [Anaerolineaceae bacterium]